MMLKVFPALVLAAVLIACGDGVGPERDTIEIHPRVVADTIESPVPSEVRIRMREDGTPPATRNVEVYAPGVSVSTDPAGAYTRTFTLDAQGTLTVFLFMGREAGGTYLRVVAGDDRDSIPVSVLPGQPVGAGFPSPDTALRQGDVYSVALRQIDRRGNRRDETISPLTLESSNQEVATIQGTAVTAVGEGTTTLRATTELGEATSSVFVLPDAELLVGPGTVLADGYGTVLGSFPEIDENDCPSWHPAGSHILTAGLRTVDPDGGTFQIPVSETGLTARCGAYSADGEWIFFEGRLSSEAENTSSIWRVRPDGSDLNRVTTAAPGERQLNPSPSPDGSRVAYTSGRALLVYSIESGTTVPLKFLDAPPVPRWSPTGVWIAYTYPQVGYGVRINGNYIWAGRLRLVRPDGSDDHSPTQQNPGFSSVAEWSPDGEWLVGAGFYNERLLFVRASDGEVLRSLPSTAQYRRPLWRP